MVCHNGNGLDSIGGQNGGMLHQKIKELREAAGWSQERLGDAIGLGPTAISKIENGRKLLRADEVQKIADALGVPISRLFGLQPEDVENTVANLSDELVPYDARPGDPFATLETENRYLLTVACDSLSRIGIMRGDIVVVDGSANAVNNRKPQSAVRAQYHPESGQPGRAVTILRQFYPPNLLVTNSTAGNAPPLFLDHDDVQVLGVIVSVHRAFNG